MHYTSRTQIPRVAFAELFLSRCYEIVVSFHKMLLFHYELTALKLHALAFTGKREIRITKGIKIGNFVGKSGLVALAMLS